MNADQREKLYAIFVEEVGEVLPKLSGMLLQLESDAETGPETLREIFRLAHTLKGSASAAGREDISQVSHEMETCLDLVRKGKLKPTKVMIDSLLGATDLIQDALARPLEAVEVAKAVAALAKSTHSGREEAPREEKVPVPAVAPAAAAGAAASAGGDLAVVLQSLLNTVAGLARGDLGASMASLREQAAQVARLAVGQPPLMRGVAEPLAKMLGDLPEGPLTPPVVEAVMLAVDFLNSALLNGGSQDEVDVVLAVIHAARATAPAAKVDPVASPPPPRAASGPSGGLAEPGPSPAHAAETAQSASVRVPVALLNQIVYRIDELVALKLRVDYQRRQVEDMQTFVDLIGGQLGAVSSESAAQLELLKRRIEQVRRDLAQEVHFLGVVSQSLQEDVKDVRMVPIGPLFEPFRRMVRDLAGALGKSAYLEIRGEEARVDKRLLDLMRDPVMHLIRNALDHGLESPSEREKAGKNPRGRILVVAESRESAIQLQISDDGRGIDPNRIRQVAVAKGVIDRERAGLLTDREAMNLIFQPGFSTAAKVTEISGRGVGLDVVRDNVGRLGGKIEFYSDLGKGSQFSLIIPLTVAASSGLLVNAASQTYCIPLQAVEEVVAVNPDDLGRSHGRLALKHRKQTITFASLEGLLGGRQTGRAPDVQFAVVLAISDRRLAVGVESVLGQEEVVVKGFTPGTPRLPLVTGATHLADGKLVAVLDPLQLVEAAGAMKASPAHKEGGAKRFTVLVVDDSLTSRAMVASVLDQAGYRTITAFDGENAFGLLQQNEIDLIVSDVEMPNLTGLDLVRRVRATPKFSRIPAILVTSLESPEERARGAEAGASGYFVKQHFDPPAFLAMVGDFLGSGS